MLFIHPLTIIYILLSLITNRFHGLVFLYLFGFIHEISHVLMAKLFKVHTQEIILYPTGFSAKISDFSNLNGWKQLLILIAGPLSFFLSQIIIIILYNFDIISIYGRRMCENYNFLILFFNLLPAYPLDGGKILDLFLANIVDEYKCRVIRICITFLISLILIAIVKSMGDLMLILFLLSGLFFSILNFKNDYYFFLIKRSIMKNKYKMKVNFKPKIYRFRNNYYLKGKQLFDEKELIEKEILKK